MSRLRHVRRLAAAIYRLQCCARGSRTALAVVFVDGDLGPNLLRIRKCDEIFLRALHELSAALNVVEIAIIERFKVFLGVHDIVPFATRRDEATSFVGYICIKCHGRSR